MLSSSDSQTLGVSPQGVTRTQAVVVGALMIGVFLVRALYEFAMLTFTSLFSHVPGFADYWLNVADQVVLFYDRIYSMFANSHFE